jgi:hypothetical protein
MIRTAFAGAVLLSAAVLVVLAFVLPERVPLHFGVKLTADRFGSRAEFLSISAAVTGGLAALFAGLAALVRRIGLEHLNVPQSAYWKTREREPRLRRYMAEDMLHIGTATLLLLSGVFALTGRAALAGTGVLSGWAVVLLVAYCGYVLGWVTWLLTRRYRPPAGDRS